ncbi:hypothetical protein KI655_18670 [Vibrio sp. D404a]|uniref:hypothetical protein n=1 Tax=unclassified Vibrio TaxID=2614977 RepID=UPI0025538D5D|nr:MULTISPECIES: hypothetical protein [unclassified Vibrio]MDK9739323.1 hypothetical protein [Vibrio sp. D404a]MDK9797642.1 hypothetical protein [Vibrio sp. D449a]
MPKKIYIRILNLIAILNIFTTAFALSAAGNIFGPIFLLLGALTWWAGAVTGYEKRKR